MAHDTEHVHEQEHGVVGHVVGPKPLIATAIALLILTVLTVAVAYIDFNNYDLPEMNIIVALSIAAVKASLVGLIFMHLLWDRPFNAFVLIASIGFVALFIALAVLDTHQYQDEVDTGNAPKVEQTLQEEGLTK